ncbi:uncharacterized protein LOC134653573 [Cydia amplana]|uniref:uncharacterized protein LOC134653573 n=1 Tax=Cydia amplana TaxID=1869771 RepID=UPI002FE69F37
MGYTFDLILNFLQNYLTLNFILFIRAIFGHHYSFRCSKLYLTIERIYCIVLSIVCPLIFYYSSNVMEYNIQWLFFEYFISIWITLIIEDDCFKKYLSSIKHADRILGLGCLNLASFRLYVVFFLIALVRICIGLLFLDNLFIRPVIYSLHAYIHTTIDFSHIIRFIIFDVLYERMIKLGTHFKNIFIQPIHDYTNMTTEVKKGLLAYKQLLDSVQLLDKIQVTVICSITYTTLVMRFIDSLLDLNATLLIDWDIAVWAPSSAFVCESIYSAMLVFFPAVFMELIHMEVDNLSWILTMEHSKCKDHNLRVAISNGISYLKLRPFQFRIWGIIPVDSSLPISFISLAFTYTFVILQVHHVL